MGPFNEGLVRLRRRGHSLCRGRQMAQAYALSGLAIDGLVRSATLSRCFPRLTRHRFQAYLYTTTGIAISGLLMWLDPWYMFLSFLIYPMVFVLLPIEGAFVYSGMFTFYWMHLISRPGDPGYFHTLAIAGASLIGAWILGRFIYLIISQSRDRRILLEQLQATQVNLSAAEREATRVAERQRIASLLHDHVVQDLATAALWLDSLQPTEAEPKIVEASKLIRSSVEALRSSIWNLRPDLVDKKLESEIDRLVKAHKGSFDLRFQTFGEPLPLLNQHLELFVRAVGEGLTNASKHAMASEVVITLSYMTQEIFLDISDNGQGPESSEFGFGLTSLQRDAESLGATLSLEPRNKGGSTLSLQLKM